MAAISPAGAACAAAAIIGSDEERVDVTSVKPTGYHYHDAPVSYTVSFPAECRLYNSEEVRAHWLEYITEMITSLLFKGGSKECASLCISYIFSYPLMQIRQLDHGPPHWMIPRQPTASSIITLSFKDGGRTEIPLIFPVYPLALKIKVLACKRNTTHTDIAIQFSSEIKDDEFAAADWMDRSTNSKQIAARKYTKVTRKRDGVTQERYTALMPFNLPTKASKTALTTSKLWVSHLGCIMWRRLIREVLDYFRDRCKNLFPLPQVFAMHGIPPGALTSLPDPNEPRAFAERCLGERNPKTKTVTVDQDAVRKLPSVTKPRPALDTVLAVADVADHPNPPKEWVDEAELALEVDASVYQSIVYCFIDADMSEADRLAAIAGIYQQHLS